MASFRSSRRAHRRLLVFLVVALATTGVLWLPRSAAGASGGARAIVPPAPAGHPGRIYHRNQLVSEPFVLTGRRHDYLYSSGLGPPLNVPLRVFSAMKHWKGVIDAMPTLPPWVWPNSSVWAPDVRKVGHHYVMWFAATTAAQQAGAPHPSRLKCLGWAVSATRTGPFVSHATTPALCQSAQYGDIDPRTVITGGHEYLLWKTNANVATAGNPPTVIYAEKLAANGTTLKGAPVALLTNTEAWEGALVESPDMVVHKGRAYLFFSANSSNAPQAAIGVTTCRGPLGPCRADPPHPFLSSNAQGEGPSEESLFSQDGATWLAYTPHATYRPGTFPDLAVARVAFGRHGPYLAAFDGARPRP